MGAYIADKSWEPPFIDKNCYGGVDPVLLCELYDGNAGST
jgi:hypothetical protein